MRPERMIRTDKSGEPFEIGISSAEDFPLLVGMHFTFCPRPDSHGLLPEDPEACQNRLKTLFRIGLNTLAPEAIASLATLR
jgi:hypothetical protein